MLSSFLTMSYEKLMIDHEICGMVRRFERGFGLQAEDLALEVIARVGPGGTFLTEPHTLKRFRSEIYLPRLANRRNLSNWQALGRPGLADAAHVEWQRVLAVHVVPAPDATIVALLDRYVEEHM